MTINLQIILIVFAATAAAVSAFTVILRDNRFRKQLKKGLESPEAMEDFREKYPPEKLILRPSRLEKFAERWGKSVISETGTAPLLAAKLEQNPGKKDIYRVLYHCPDEYICRAFLTGLKNEKLRPILIGWLNDNGPELSLKVISNSCRGEDFSGTDAFTVLKDLFNGNPDPIIELTGSPDWHIRHFSYQLILNNDDIKCERAVWDGFSDTHPLVRKTVAENFQNTDRKKLYKELWTLLLNDPVFEVRKTAKDRILNDFADIYSPGNMKLESSSALRFLQLLKDGSPEETNIAMEFLKNSDLELRFPAASYLQKNGILDKLLLNAPFEDREELERNYSLLKMAMEVNVTSFLKKVDTNSSAGTLLTAGRLLNKGGNRSLITPLAEAVFNFFNSRNPGPEYLSIYKVLLEVIRRRGDDESLFLMKQELLNRKKDQDHLELLLPAIPHRGDSIFLPTLIGFLKDDTFPCRDSLINILSSFPPELLLPDIFDILDGFRGSHSHTVRISALKLLNRLKLPYCLQCILEHLPVLPREEAIDFATVLNEYPKDDFDRKTAELFKTSDGQIRAALIRVLPAIGNKTFIKETRSALKDTDPEVRIAAIEALLSFGEIKLLNQETSMLRDPVERVRLATAGVIGEYGIPAALQILEDILNDENETTPVKKTAITGLGASETLESLDLLINLLDQDSPFQKEIISALAERRSKKDLTRLLKIFEEASPALRENLVQAFKLQEEKSEPALLKLLQEDSLKPYISEVLDATGYTGKTIRKLTHRDIRVRKQAAGWLSKLGSKSSYRGLVLAARDPDQEIRVMVVKALEKLNTPEGSEILEELKNDPDRRIRKYTLWAMERLKALALD